MKINLTKLRELANKTGEGEDHIQKIRNAQEFVYSISPMLIVDLIDEIERLRGALGKVKESTGTSTLAWHDADDALAAHDERFE